MGAVYSARDLTLGRDVAIKILNDDAPSDSGATAAKLLHEARHASSLNHPNISAIHHIVELDDRYRVVMEFVSGQTLATLTPPEGLPLEQVLRYGIQLTAGTAHAHEHRVVHGDLKSANVMVADSGRLTILDFGLARRLSDIDEITRSLESLGGVGTVAGTLPYMAPELLMGRGATPASDLWALGVILYEMSTGSRPFQGATPSELAASILRDGAPPLPERLPAALRAVIARCLSKNPSRRYQTGSELHAALEMVSPRVTPSAAEAPRDPLASAGAAGERRRVWWAIAALAAALIAALAAFATWRGGNAATVRSYQLVSTFPGAHRSGSMSPDGGSIAFIQDDAQGVAQVWVKSLGVGEPRQITEGAEPASRPRWARGNQIVFARRGAGIWSVAPLGGHERQIVPWA